MSYFFILLSITCLTYALIKKKFSFLLLPLFCLFTFLIIEILLVPAPLGETLKFIFSLR